MNKDIETAKKHVYALESIRGDMYVKYVEYATKNPKADLKPLQDKLSAMAEASDYIMQTIDLVEATKKELIKKEKLINSLLAEVGFKI